MTNPLPFARFTQLMKVIDQLPISLKIYNQHRMEYDYILGQVSLASSKGSCTSVGDLTHCPILGSQPTANKRIHELIGYGLLEVKLSEDRRVKLLCPSEAGINYLISCSELMREVTLNSEM